MKQPERAREWNEGDAPHPPALALDGATKVRRRRRERKKKWKKPMEGYTVHGSTGGAAADRAAPKGRSVCETGWSGESWRPAGCQR
jgi:hypothetical protein